MTRIALIAIFIVIGFQCQSQKSQKIVKFFSGYDSYSETRNYGNSSTTNTTTNNLDEKNFRLLKSISLGFIKENTFHEIEIGEIQITNSTTETLITTLGGSIATNGYDITTTLAAFRYSYNYIFNKEAKLIAIAGVALAPSFQKIMTEPRVGSFKRTTSLYEVHLEILSRIQYKLSSSFLIELYVPISITSTQTRNQRNFDPALTIEQQTISESSISFIDVPTQFSLGIGYRL